LLLLMMIFIILTEAAVLQSDAIGSIAHLQVMMISGPVFWMDVITV